MGLLPHKDEELRRRREAWFRKGPFPLFIVWPNNWKGWLWYLLAYPAVLCFALGIRNVFGNPLPAQIVLGVGMIVWIIVIYRNTIFF